MDLLPTAFEGLCSRQVVGQFAASGAELKGLLHLLEHLLVVLEGDYFGLPLNSFPAGSQKDILNAASVECVCN